MCTCVCVCVDPIACVGALPCPLASWVWAQPLLDQVSAKLPEVS